MIRLQELRVMKKPTVIQIDKYDINQKIIKILADLEARTVLFSIKRKARHAEDISRKNKIPLSTVYKKLRELQELALIKIEKRGFSEHGRVTKYYKSRIREAQISIRELESKLTLYRN